MWLLMAPFRSHVCYSCMSASAGWGGGVGGCIGVEMVLSAVHSYNVPAGRRWWGQGLEWRVRGTMIAQARWFRHRPKVELYGSAPPTPRQSPLAPALGREDIHRNQQPDQYNNWPVPRCEERLTYQASKGHKTSTVYPPCTYRSCSRGCCVACFTNEGRC